MRILAIALCVTLAGPALGQTALAEVAAQTALPGWLAGAWEQKDGETWADEFWSPPRTGIMMGAARIGKATVLAAWEHTRILRKPDGSLSFYAQPSGVPASEFPMVTQGPQMIEFANPAHDYSQRIRYWREGRLLLAEISRLDGSSAHRWSYAPMRQ